MLKNEKKILLIFCFLILHMYIGSKISQNKIHYTTRKFKIQQKTRKVSLGQKDLYGINRNFSQLP